MSNNDEWNPTFRTPDGEELERSDWGEWRNGPQRPTGEGADPWVMIECRASTRRALSEAKLDGESYDQTILRLLEQGQDQEADR